MQSNAIYCINIEMVNYRLCASETDMKRTYMNSTDAKYEIYFSFIFKR